MTTLRAELLINGDSRRSRHAVQEILHTCEQYGITITETTIARATTLDASLRAIKRRSPKLLIVGSGDGTLSHLVDFFADTPLTFGIIPLGTTNNFARSLALPLTIDHAIKRIAEGGVKKIDLGYLKGTYFANVAGIGISARIAGGISDATKRRFGRFAYALEGAKQLLRHKPFTVTVEDKDGELQLNYETRQVIIANGRYHAGREIAIGASLASRELIIFTLGGRSRLSFIIAMLDFYVGKRKSVRHSSHLIGRDVMIRTSTPQPIELDGEVRTKTPCSVSVQPRMVAIRGAK